MAKYKSKGSSKGGKCYPENDSKTLMSGTPRPVPNPLPTSGGGGMKSGVVKSKASR